MKRAPYSSGSLVRADGARIPLAASDVALTVLEHWTSGTSGVRYPVAWRLEAPAVGITLDVRPYLENQELDLSVLAAPKSGITLEVSPTSRTGARFVGALLGGRRSRRGRGPAAR